LFGRRERQLRSRKVKWQNSALSALLPVVVSAFLGGCNAERSFDPLETFQQAKLAFLLGDFAKAQSKIDEASRRSREPSSELAWKFRLLEAEIRANRGLNQDVLSLLNSPLPPSLAHGDLAIQKQMVLGIAYARLGRFHDADQSLADAQHLSDLSHSSLVGELARAFGVVAVESGNLENAERHFRNSLQLSRQEGDRFLELTALLNLGVVAIGQERYDESTGWSNDAYRIAQEAGARQTEEKALGNLAWAYYKMGDFDKSLSLFLEAADKSQRIGAVIDEAEWLNNSGLVQYQLGQFSIAEGYYRRSLALAQEIEDKEEIVDALTALAFVSVRQEKLDPAKKYSVQALELAQAEHDRAAELYPFLVKGQIAAQTEDAKQAEEIFLEVSRDPKSDLSLRWEAQNELAKLYEDGNRPGDAEKQFRLALSTFENARSSFQREDFRLPFLANAAHLYDDYIHFLLEHGRVDDALRTADYSRAQTLAEGLGISRKTSIANPDQLDAKQVARQSGATILFYWLGAERSYLWAVTPNDTALFQLPPAAEINSVVERYRKALVGPRDVLEVANPDGSKLFETLIAPAKKFSGGNSRVVIIPDGSLSNLNFETLLVSDPKPHYWIEDVTIINATSLRLLASSGNPRKSGGKLLLMGDAIAPNREYGDLPQAAVEMANIERHFVPAERTVYARAGATAPAYLGSNPSQFSYVHFVAHGTASRLSPLDSAIVLSKSDAEEDSFKLYARDIIHRPLHADLVTISTCYGAGARAYTGEGLVGLSWAFLRAGAHNVIGALWEVSDVSTPQLMGNLYGELKKGRRPEAALRTAKLSLLHSSGVFRKPFYWAPFQLYAGS
jgi:CHAT domain-containing protein/tetratricopeptide (TPR) repeat protein